MRWCFITVLCFLQVLTPALHAHVGGGHGSPGPHLHQTEIPVTFDPAHAALTDTPGLEVGVSAVVLGRDGIEVVAESSSPASPDAPPLSHTLVSMSVAPTAPSHNPAIDGPSPDGRDRLPPARAPPPVR